MVNNDWDMMYRPVLEISITICTGRHEDGMSFGGHDGMTDPIVVELLKYNCEVQVLQYNC